MLMCTFWRPVPTSRTKLLRPASLFSFFTWTTILNLFSPKSKLPCPQYWRSHGDPNPQECVPLQGGNHWSQKRGGGSWLAGDNNNSNTKVKFVIKIINWNLCEAKFHRLTSHKESLGSILSWKILPWTRRRWAWEWYRWWLGFLLQLLFGFFQNGVSPRLERGFGSNRLSLVHHL